MNVEMEAAHMRIERIELQEENEQLRVYVRKLEALIRSMLENDPNDGAADGISVLDVWRKDAEARLAEKP